jgi:hypothetical protein
MWALAFVVILVASIFVRDVNRSAHNSTSPRRSENRDFAALAHSLIEQENLFDRRLDYLLLHGQSLSRPVFAARLAQLDQELPAWVTQSALLESPSLAHHVNRSLATLTMIRVDDYQSLIVDLASALHFPWVSSTPLGANQSYAAAQASLVASVNTWAADRLALEKEPGHVRLPATSGRVGSLDLSTVVSTLTHSPTLEVTREIGNTAVLVSPSPLPAPSGELLLPPTRSVRLGITVTNASYVLQPVAMTYTFVQTNGARVSQTQTMTTTLSPLGSFAFVPKMLSAVSGERAELTIAVSGAPAGPKMSITRRYLVIVSPSGNS